MKNQVFAYIRTSNTNLKIAKESDSKSRQLKSIRAFCRSKGWKIKEIFYDLGVSGDNGCDLSQREAFSEMLAEMKSNGIKGFVVADAARYSRSIITAAIIGEELRKNGITCLDASTGRDLVNKNAESPEESLIANILLCVSEFEKVKTTSRLLSGKLRKRRAGGYIGGVKPFGKDPNDIKVKNRIKQMRNAFADDDGRFTKTRIAKVLNEEGYRTRRGTKYSVQNVYHIVKTQSL
jgi:DNA invertase Pin-like site-specific DNA recombinase